MSKTRWTVFIILILTSLSCGIAILRDRLEPPKSSSPPRFLLPRPAGAQASASGIQSTDVATPSPNWIIRTHGECCEGNLAAAGPNIFVLLPVLVNGARIQKSTDNGNTWVDKYPPAPASVPFGIEGDMQAWGTDVTFFGTELAVMVTAHSDDFGETFIPVQNPLASAGNDQSWSYLGPFGGLRPGGALSTDEPYVQAGWMRIGSALVFSFDGGLTYPLQTPLAGVDGNGSEHIVCRQTAHDPTSPGDTRIANQDFKNHKAGRYGAWGTDRKFYWAEPSISGVAGNNESLYVCKTDNFGATWTGIKHPISPGPGQDFVVSHTAFDNNGTLYVLHGDKLYVSFNQGESFAFVHTIPHYGSAVLADPGSDQFFVVNCGTIHIAIAEAVNGVPGGDTNMWYLRGAHVDTATPTWDTELVETVGNNRLDFIQIVVNGNNIPVMSYTKPDPNPNDNVLFEVTTAARVAPLGSDCAVSLGSVVSRKTHGGLTPPPAGPGDLTLNLDPSTAATIEPRSGGSPTGDHTLVFTFPNTLNATTPVASITATATTSSGTQNVSASGSLGTDTHQYLVNLTAVPNASHVSVTLHGVTDTANNSGDIAPVRMDVLWGDVNSSKRTDNGDAIVIRNLSGTIPSVSDTTSVRADVNISGRVDNGDAIVVRNNSGAVLPP
jgi:hypothetical protein